MSKLNEYCIISGSPVKEYNGERNYVATGDIDKNKIISLTPYSYEKKPSRANQNVNQDEIIFAKMKSTIKVLKIDDSNKDYIYSTGFYVVQPKKDILPQYLYWFFNTPKFNNQKDKYCVGATMKALNNSGFSKIEIGSVPSLEEQKKIISYLDKIQDGINNREMALEDLEKLVTAKLSECLNNYTIKNDRLGNYINTQGGYAFKSSEFKKDGIPIVRIGNANLGYFTPKDLKFYEEKKELEKYLLFPGDMVMTLTGTVGKDDYGNVCILGNDYDKYYLNQRNMKISSDTFNNLYLKYLLRKKDIKSKIIKSNRGVRQANISNKDIENLQIPIIEKEHQDALVKDLIKIEELKEKAKNDIVDLNKLLCQKLNEFFN